MFLGVVRFAGQGATQSLTLVQRTSPVHHATCRPGSGSGETHKARAPRGAPPPSGSPSVGPVRDLAKRAARALPCGAPCLRAAPARHRSEAILRHLRHKCQLHAIHHAAHALEAILRHLWPAQPVYTSTSFILGFCLHQTSRLSSRPKTPTRTTSISHCYTACGGY